MAPESGSEQPAAIESRILEVPAAEDAGTGIPITIIRGTRPGPTLALIAGNHGHEYPPILALQKLRGQIDPAELRGRILMVHAANMPSFLGRAFAITTEVIERPITCWICLVGTAMSGCDLTSARTSPAMPPWIGPLREWRWHLASTT